MRVREDERGRQRVGEREMEREWRERERRERERKRAREGWRESDQSKPWASGSKFKKGRVASREQRAETSRAGRKRSAVNEERKQAERTQQNS